METLFPLRIRAGYVEGPERRRSDGYGELAPDETARSSEVQAAMDGADPAEQERAEVRANLRSESQKPPGESPGLLGDRLG